MVAKLDAGGSVVVSVIGGSVSRGHGGPDGAGDHNAGHPGSWSRLIYDYINVRWPGRHHVYANGAVAATGARESLAAARGARLTRLTRRFCAGSPYFAQCLARHLHKEADLVLLEFAVNDGHNSACPRYGCRGPLRVLTPAPCSLRFRRPGHNRER